MHFLRSKRGVTLLVSINLFGLQPGSSPSQSGLYMRGFYDFTVRDGIPQQYKSIHILKALNELNRSEMVLFKNP